MAGDLGDLENWVAPLLQKLSAGERRKLARTIATDVRKEQRERIKEQRAPDGTSYTPRKPSARKRGRIKEKAMFSKLRTARFMKTTATATGASIEFRGGAATIARVHQYGLTDRVSRKSPLRVRYASRPLLGVSARTESIVERAVIDHLKQR
ncbi:hypothetical protein R84981_001126 [Carnimonas sp. R-84981]|uniref:phage virion morphogenesis protein n=1 Tax=Carnimonas bestiolae TaxID=3402172 RepID=UPI003EDB736F